MPEQINSQVLSSLRSDVGRRFGFRLETSTDFANLSLAIAESKAGYISPSTLKRFWGYVKDVYSSKRLSTLDTLARYIGYNGFNHYSGSFKQSESSLSDFNSSNSLDVQTLSAGSHLRVTWFPNRILSMTYLGQLTFSIDESINSRLTPGHKVKCLTLVKGQPLILNVLMSDSPNSMHTFTAGKKHGIDWEISD